MIQRAMRSANPRPTTAQKVIQFVHERVAFPADTIPSLYLGVYVAGSVDFTPEQLFVLLHDDRAHRPGAGIITVREVVRFPAKPFIGERLGETEDFCVQGGKAGEQGKQGGEDYAHGG
jgi:hypothetical protein